MIHIRSFSGNLVLLWETTRRRVCEERARPIAAKRGIGTQSGARISKLRAGEAGDTHISNDSGGGLLMFHKDFAKLLPLQRIGTMGRPGARRVAPDEYPDLDDKVNHP